MSELVTTETTQLHVCPSCKRMLSDLKSTPKSRRLTLQKLTTQLDSQKHWAKGIVDPIIKNAIVQKIKSIELYLPTVRDREEQIRAWVDILTLRRQITSSIFGESFPEVLETDNCLRVFSEALRGTKFQIDNYSWFAKEVVTTKQPNRDKGVSETVIFVKDGDSVLEYSVYRLPHVSVEACGEWLTQLYANYDIFCDYPAEEGSEFMDLSVGYRLSIKSATLRNKVVEIINGIDFHEEELKELGFQTEKRDFWF